MTGPVYQLEDLLGDFGERWEITKHEDTDGWYLAAEPRPRVPGFIPLTCKVPPAMRDCLTQYQARHPYLWQVA